MKYKEDPIVPSHRGIFACLTLVLKNWLHILISLCFSQGLFAQALNAPLLRCIQIQSNGNAIVQWTQVPDPLGQFVAYHIWNASSSAGIFTEVGSAINIVTTTFTHVIATPLVSDECYYVVAESNDGATTFFSAPSVTLCSISLDVLPSISPPGQVLINWSDPYPSGIPFVGSTYEVWMEYPAGTWTLAQTLPYGTNTWGFEVSRCEVDYNFQIILPTPFGCAHESDISGGTFFDITPPDIPEVTSVSIDHATNDAIVEWNASAAPDTQGYILYRCGNSGNVTLLDTVFGAQQTQFIDLLAPVNLGPVCYLLASIDTCYSGIPPSPNTSPTSDICSCSIFVSPIPYAICSESLEINWTFYTGWSDNPQGYSIYHSVDGSVPELIGTVQGTLNSFVHEFTEIVSGVHSYYVEALSVEGYISRSNLQNVLITYPTEPAFNYLSSASVTGQTEVTVTLQTPPASTEHYFHLQRRKFDDANWEEILVLDNIVLSELVFEDPDVAASSFPFNYRILVRNLCDVWVDTTNFGKTIFLRGLANTDRLVNVLQWTHYEGWENGVLAYRIYRKTGQNGFLELVGEVNGTQTYYEDDVADLLYSEGRFCYTVEAVERPSTLFPGTSFTANSNELCLIQEPVIWVPSAFVVDGFNTTFQPIISFADFNNYQMIIYSRWGDVIYQTTVIEEPWDGRMNGEMVQEGVYAYFVSVEDGNGRPYEARGTVMMLSNRDQ